MDPTISTAILAGVEKLVNAALIYDPGSRIAIAKLAPQVLAVAITSPSCIFYVVPDEKGVRIMGHWEGEVTTRLEGSFASLLLLIKSHHINLKDSGIQIVGSTSFLAELQTIIAALDVDWEEILSQVSGDIVGPQIANLLRQQWSWAKTRGQNLQRLAGEFVTEEYSVFPGQSEIAFFNHQVDELRLDVDRLAARFEQLLAK